MAVLMSRVEASQQMDQVMTQGKPDVNAGLLVEAKKTLDHFLAAAYTMRHQADLDQKVDVKNSHRRP